MNYKEFKTEISILKNSPVKTVNWKSVAENIGSTRNTVLKYVNSEERPPSPDLVLCAEILKSAKTQFITDYEERTIVKQRLEAIAV